MQTAHPASEMPQFRLDITGTSYPVFTVCASMVTTGHIPTPTSASTTDHAKYLYHNLIFLPPAPRYGHHLAGYLPEDCRRRKAPGQTITAFPHITLRSCLQSHPSLSCNGLAYRMANPFSSTEFENSEVEYFISWQEGVQTRTKRYVILVPLLYLTDVDYCPVSWHVSSPAN